jgi:hypothetical protein
VNSFGPEILAEHHHRVHFYAYGLAGENKATDANSPIMYTLDTLMQMNGALALRWPLFIIPEPFRLIPGHAFIDILKIDIEGWEFELAPFLQHYIDLDQPLPFGQLQLELHVWQRGFRDVLTFWELLEKAGLRPYMTEVCLLLYLRAEF